MALWSAMSISASWAATGDLEVEVDIKSQAMSTSLIELAKKANVQIVLDKSLNAEKSVPAISGSFTLNHALETLLDGTGLTFEYASDDLIMVRKDEKSESDAVPEDQVEEVVVTGTRLKGHNPASPVVTIDRTDIERGGYSSIEDVLRRLPQNVSSITSFGADLGQGEFGDSSGDRFQSSLGATGVNLRGLGSRSSLVLINGRRKAGSAQRVGAFTDLSSIPLSQIERIDILTDGASAIYGSDAVAGVINVILRKDYEGLDLRVRHENSGAGADVSRINGAYSFNWDSGRLSISADTSETKSADTSKFVHTGPTGLGDFMDLGGVNTRLLGFGQPAPVYEVDYAPPWAPWLPPRAVQGDYVAGSGGPDQSIYHNPRIGPTREARSIRINGDQELTDTLMFSADVSVTQQENTSFWEPNINSGGWSHVTPNHMTHIPASNVHNPYGREVMVGYGYDAETSGMEWSRNDEVDSRQASFTLSGELPFIKSWNFTLDYTHSEEKGNTTNHMGVFSSSEDGAEIIANVLDNINVFTDAMDPAVVASNVVLMNSMVFTEVVDYTSEADAFELTVNGTLFELPAGDVQMAAGMNYREEELFRTYELRSESSDSGHDRSVESYFVELGIPLLSELPFIENLTLTLAARRESVEQKGNSTLTDNLWSWSGSEWIAQPTPLDSEALVGMSPTGEPWATTEGIPVSGDFSSTSPSVKLSWVVNPNFRVRASWGESFLSPLAGQLFGGVSLNDMTWNFHQNGLQLPDGLDPDATLITEISGANPNLEAQTAETLTYGFVVTPEALPGFNFDVSYNRTRYDNYIASLSMFDNLPLLAGKEHGLPELFKIDTENNLLGIVGLTQNFSSRLSESVDINTTYEFDTDFGVWEFRLAAVRTLKLRDVLAEGIEPEDIVDTEFGPSKWAGNVSANWNYENYNVNLAVNHTSGHRVIEPRSGNPYTGVPDDERIAPLRTNSKGYTTVDLQLGYQFDDIKGLLSNTTLRLGAQNLLDEEFPFVDNRIGYAANRVNTRGRVIYLDISKNFNL